MDIPKKMSRCSTVVHGDDNTGRVIMATDFYRSQEVMLGGKISSYAKEIQKSNLLSKFIELHGAIINS